MYELSGCAPVRHEVVARCKRIRTGDQQYGENDWDQTGGQNNVLLFRIRRARLNNFSCQVRLPVCSFIQLSYRIAFAYCSLEAIVTSATSTVVKIVGAVCARACSTATAIARTSSVC